MPSLPKDLRAEEIPQIQKMAINRVLKLSKDLDVKPSTALDIVQKMLKVPESAAMAEEYLSRVTEFFVANKAAQSVKEMVETTTSTDFLSDITRGSISEVEASLIANLTLAQDGENALEGGGANLLVEVDLNSNNAPAGALLAIACSVLLMICCFGIKKKLCGREDEAPRQVVINLEDLGDAAEEVVAAIRGVRNDHQFLEGAGNPVPDGVDEGVPEGGIEELVVPQFPEAGHEELEDLVGQLPEVVERGDEDLAAETPPARSPTSITASEADSKYRETTV